MKTNTKQTALLAILVAVTAVVQTVSALLTHFGFFSVSLVMIPLVVAVSRCGMKGGLVIGGAFGVTVFLHCLMGLDVGGAILIAQSWVFTFILTVLRGIAAGALTALVYMLLRNMRNITLRRVITAACAPLFNTGIFVIFLRIFFNDTLHLWANDSGFNDAFSYVILGLVGINFVFEFISTVLLAPPICAAVEKTRRS